jgi:hypothetical protein
MEILKINILPELEIVKREAFKNSLSCCDLCSTALEFTYTDFKEYRTVREEAQCQTCGAKVCRDHKLQ